jgi:tetratricopeptide (TPR) repeat protein
MDSLGTIKHSVAGPVEALAFRQKIANDNLPVWKEYQQEDSVRREWANLQLRLAVCHIEMREFPLATKALERAENLLREQDPNDRLLMARVKHSRGTLHKWIDNNNASAAPEFRRAVELAKLYAIAFPNDKLALATANNSQGWLADCETQLGNLDLAETLMREVYDNYTALTNSPDATYLVRLEKGRVAFALMNLLITRGQIGPALAWSKQVGPEIQLLQSSNPTLMETAALKIGFDCHIVSAEIHDGDFEPAMEHAKIALTQAAELEQRFPNTTRTWQVHGHAKQMWFIAAMHVADYGDLRSFLEDWIKQIDVEIQQQKNVGFNQQLKLTLLMNLAIALDWSGDVSVAAPVWGQAIELAPNEQKPAYKLLSEIASCRTSLQEGERLKPLESNSGFNRSVELVASITQGMPYPSANHLMAEVYAVSAHLLSTNQGPDELSTIVRAQMEQYQQTAKQFLQKAHATGFYRVGDRLLNFRNDPVFADEAYQSIVVE